MIHVVEMSADIFGTWVAPVVTLIVGGGVVAVVSAVLGRSRDKREHADDDLKEAQSEQRKSELEQRQLVNSLGSQVAEMHAALLGTPYAVGLVDRVKKIETTLFENGGKHNTVLDRLGRIEKAANSTDG